MSQPNEQYKELVLKKVEPNIIQDIDGYFYFNLNGNMRGYFNSNQLRIIADRLDELNKPMEEKINNYFKNNTNV